MADSKEIELENSPTDTPARVKFAPQSDQLLVASWDSTLRLYDANSKHILSTYSFRAPVLDCAFSADGSTGYGVSVDTSVRQYTLASESMTILGQHAGVVSRACYSNSLNSLATGSWDHTLKLWDARQAKALTHTQDLPERVYDMDLVQSSSLLVVALAGRTFEIYDIRKFGEPVQRRESSLKYMTRAVACMPSGDGYATGSTEGRIAVEYFDPNPTVQAKKYAFKCHRQTVDEEDRVAPVNALAFHPVHGTFASGGSDGAVSIWDHTAKKRLRMYPKYHSAVTSIGFNHDGSKMAIAVGFLHEGGLGEPNGKNTIFIKSMGEDAKSRTK